MAQAKNNMKILWLCNARFSCEGRSSSGTWLQPLAEMVNDTDGYTLYNITIGSVNAPNTETVNGIKQYLLPLRGKASFKQWYTETCNEIYNIVEEIKPDIVHIWGTENIWGLVYKDGFINAPAFLEMQGMPSVSFAYYGGLTWKEKLQCLWAPLSLYQFPKNTIWWGYRQFKELGNKEKKIIEAFNVISVQSRWVEEHVLHINHSAQILHTRIILREPFYNCESWQWHECGESPIIFSTCSRNAPYKGLHVLLKAVGILKKRFPNIKLNLAGQLFGTRGLFYASGYTRYLYRIIKEYNIEDNIHFLGALTAEQIIKYLQESNVSVIPSFIESYSLGLAESMMVGTPTVVSYAAAMPEFAKDKEEVLFYDSLDVVSCAARIEDIFTHKELSERLSRNSRFRKFNDCDQKETLRIQLENYGVVSHMSHI